MRLAVFARGLVNRPTGRGFYAREMIAALRRVEPSLDLIVYAGEPMELPGCEVRRARGSNSLSDAWKLWRGAASDLRAIAPDALWGTTHLLPRGLPEGLPRIVTLHDLVWRDHPETMRWANLQACRWLESGLAEADRIVCISEFTRSRLVAYFPHLATRAAVIMNAPNPRLDGMPSSADASASLAWPRPFVVSVGTLEPRKRLDVLLDAMDMLPEFHLMHCGAPGWKASALLRRADRMPNVRRLGYADEETMAGLYREAVAAVFPSMYEGFHLPPLDAASVGCPVVVSDIPVHREVLGDAAVYFPAGDARALADGLRALAGNPAERRARIAAARERAGRYRWEHSAKGLLDLVRQAVEEKRLSPTAAGNR